METLFVRPIRLTGAAALLAAAILLINPLGSASAWAAGNGGDHGGARDQVQQNSNAGYTNYSATPGHARGAVPILLWRGRHRRPEPEQL